MQDADWLQILQLSDAIRNEAGEKEGDTEWLKFVYIISQFVFHVL